MAFELAAAIRARQKLRLGSIWDPTDQHEPYRAVFVWPDKASNRARQPTTPAFVFTSAREGGTGSEAHDANDVDRHVALDVDLTTAPLGGSTSTAGNLACASLMAVGARGSISLATRAAGGLEVLAFLFWVYPANFVHIHIFDWFRKWKRLLQWQ